jgi:hypothetical protein
MTHNQISRSWKGVNAVVQYKYVHRISLSTECINSALFMVLLWVDSLLTVLCKLRIACNLLSHAYLQIISQVAMRAGNNGKRLTVSHRARAKEVYPFRLIKCKALDGCFSFKLNNYCVRLHCSMHNAHVIYVCAARACWWACLPLVLHKALAPWTW